MKKLYIALLLLATSVGCSNIKFDGLQYDRFVTIYEVAVDLQSKCGDPSAVRKDTQSIRQYVHHMATYAEFRSNSPEIQRSSKALLSMVQEFSDKYAEGMTPPSVPYCTEKLKNIADGSRLIASTLGAQ
jgi:hypothetical protein